MRNQHLRSIARAGQPARDTQARDTQARDTQARGKQPPGTSLPDPGSAAHSLVEWLAIAVPALSTITAFLFLFGWTYTNTRLSYFGIDHTILGFTTADYVLRSVDAVYVPAAVVTFLILTALLTHTGLMALVRRSVGLATFSTAGYAALGLGTLAAAVGFWAMFLPVPFVSAYLLPAALQGGGVTLAAYGFRLLQRVRAQRAGLGTVIPRWERRCYWLVAIIVTLNLFWASAQFASALGTVRAAELERDLAAKPSVTVFSKHDLALSHPVLTARLAPEESAYSFQYTGLRLIIHSGGKYFLLSEGWQRSSGTAVVLVESPDVRLEFAPGKVAEK